MKNRPWDLVDSLHNLCLKEQSLGFALARAFLRVRSAMFRWKWAEHPPREVLSSLVYFDLARKWLFRIMQVNRASLETKVKSRVH